MKPDRKTAVVLAAIVVPATLAPLAASGQPCEGAPTATRLNVVVEGVRSDKGLMTSSLYPDDRSQFLVTNGALKVWRVPAKAPVTTMCMWLKGAGTFAVAVYQDLNANHRLDIGALGPTEPYGFSNNPRIFLSKPSLDSVKFQAGAGETTIHVRLHNP
ncbi:MAG TPA: DUF2141 domain-containing protein [Caulobacteraceae bacterium]|nr:DUF2141 domain-containing protein [Caulobacteraceae bacterium]